MRGLVILVLAALLAGYKKQDEVTAEEKFIAFPMSAASWGARFDYIARNIKAPLRVAYGLVDCDKYQSDENTLKAIEQALISGIDKWLIPMREVGEERKIPMIASLIFT